MTNEELNTKLYQQMSEELDEYKDELLSMPSAEALEHAYAYTVKQDIVLAMEELNLSDKQCKALLQESNPLEKVFERWENHESHYMDDIRDMIECTAIEKYRDDFLKSERDSR